MRVKILMLVGALLLGLASLVDSFAQTKVPAKKPAAAPMKPAATAKKPAASATKKAPAKKTVRRPVRRRAVARRAPAPSNQRVPTKDRYAEIQQALADAGHFTGEPNGAWTLDSIEALKAFQAEQGFEPTGKINSRSLIKLGLGPQYDAAGTEPTATPASDTRQPG